MKNASNHFSRTQWEAHDSPHKSRTADRVDFAFFEASVQRVAAVLTVFKRQKVDGVGGKVPLIGHRGSAPPSRRHARDLADLLCAASQEGSELYQPHQSVTLISMWLGFD